MKIRTCIMIATLILSCAVVFADSPPKGTVAYSKVPYRCLTDGTATGQEGEYEGWKFTCVKQDTSDVFHQITGTLYTKTIYKADAEPTSKLKDFGYVVEQNETTTITVPQPKEENRVAIVKKGEKKETISHERWQYKGK